MFYYVTVTTECDLKCTYCYGKACDDSGRGFESFEIDYDVPTFMKYDIEDLRLFLEKDPYPVIIFYGGEPLLNIRKVEEIIDRVHSEHYMIQTNGLHLEDVQARYLDRFHTILVSIDGDQRQTDRNRGSGTYQRIVRNLRELRKKGFRGEIIGRMTVPVNTDIERQVRHLLQNDDYPFTSIHWQLDAQFWQMDFDEHMFERWVFECYNPQVGNLVEFWIESMEERGEVLKIYPFIGIVESMLKGTGSKLRCGAGWIEFNIQTDGTITPCPVMAGMKDFYLGNIIETNPMDLMNRVLVTEPCPQCKIYDLCGGRCLYANVTKLWGERGYRLVCSTVEHLIHLLEKLLPRVENLIRGGILSIKDFEYTRYNSCEIVP